MLILSLIATTVWAGELVVDAKVPVEVQFDGQTAAQLFVPGVVRLAHDPGTVALTLYVDGSANRMDVAIPDQGAATVIVGRTGITTGSEPAKAPVIGTAGHVEFRVAGGTALMLQLDDQRIALAGGEVKQIALTSGDHRMAVRDSSGQVIWARGTLAVGGDPMVVQLTEGHVPEVSGGVFRPDGH